jgi:hypothetical protein
MKRWFFFLGLLIAVPACGPGGLHQEDIGYIRQLVSNHRADIHRAPSTKDAVHATNQYLQACQDTLESMGYESCHMMSLEEMGEHMSSIRGLLKQHGDTMGHATGLNEMGAQADHHANQMGRSLDRFQTAHGGGHGGMHMW